MSDIPSPKITVRYVPHTEAPGRPVRIDYASIAHEYVTRLDAIEINRDSTLGIRCKEATGLEPDWVEQGMSEAYSQLAAILTTLDAPAKETITESDFDLFPVKPGLGGDFEVRKDADGGFTVLGGCKVSDSDDRTDFPPIRDLSMDMRPILDLTGKVPPCPRAPATDPVHAPSHYTDGGIETIDYLRAKLSREAFIGFCRGNALKYLSRAGKKGSAAEDYAKAAVYCRWAEEASR